MRTVVADVFSVPQTKNEYANEDAIIDDAAAQAYIEQFAQETLDRAERVIKANKVTPQTASTFDAALTFFNLVNIWGPPDGETSQKIKYAKWNAARITKAIKEGKDPNDTNPKKEDLPPQQPALDPADPEVQALGSPGQAPKPATVEDAPDADLRREIAGMSLPPPSSAAASIPPSVPDDGELKLPSAPGYGDESEQPAAQPGYFDPPPSLPSPVSPPSHTPANLTSGANAPSAPDNWAPTPPPVTTTFSPPPRSAVPPAGPPTFAPSYSPTAAVAPPPVSPPSNPPAAFTSVAPPANVSRPVVPPPTNPAYSHPAPTVPGGFSQVPQQVSGNFTVDDAAMSQAQKHARWAISALNFEDVPTAVRELRRALESLNAS